VVTPRENSINGILLSPVVRRILIDGQVDPSTISGTGPGGAISRRDAELAVLRGPTPEVALAQSAGRRRMGQHMAHSWSTAPHGFVAIEVAGDCFTQLDQLNAASSDVPIADEVVVALAAVRALAEFPVLNATIDGEQVMQQRSVNLGFAQSLGDDGMLVPVVHAVAGLKLRSLSQRVHELNAHVATRQLSADDLIGGTFTIQGAESKNAITSQPLLIQPQVAVLSVHVQRNVPVVVTSDVPTLSVGNTLVLGLSFDHRVCDAWTAAAFLESVATHLTELDLTDEG
jgi:2-oxoglutarate dehydrogenase E2 component (dihydrolipoamide succinyltransferase)